MDFREYIKNLQSGTQWINYQAQVLTPQKGYGNTTPISTLTTATYNYANYEQRDLIAQGRFYLSTVNVYTTNTQ
jgi:hypothetical protein